MRFTMIVGIVSLCAGCSSGSGIDKVPADEYPSDGQPVPDTIKAGEGKSGERLKRRVMSADDGALVDVGWYDVERQERCAFRVGPDGKQRCMPTELVHEINGLSGSNAVVYSDEECKNPIFVAATAPAVNCGTLARYVFQAPEARDNCEAKYYYTYHIGAEIVLPDGQLYTKRDIGCHEFNVADEVTAFEATEIPASDFVGAEEKIDE
jgi:hypothetical protein